MQSFEAEFNTEIMGLLQQVDFFCIYNKSD